MIKDIYDFENYTTNDVGEICNKKSGRILHHYDTNGYERVVLSKHGKPKRIPVHRIVAQAFIPNPNNLPQVNHKNGDKKDNRVENLEWCTRSENQRHRVDILKRGTRPVRCVETGVEYISARHAADAVNSHAPNITRACQNKSTAKKITLGIC